jgi:7-cyano-7-deazaguanine reductase
MSSTTGYTPEHAARGLDEIVPPPLEAWPNQYPDRDYEIEIEIPEFTCRCPKTGQPDFAALTVRYIPDASCVELKSLKLHLQAFREVGIFHENIVNRLHDELQRTLRPRRLEVLARFAPRGGLVTTVRAGETRPR